MDGGNIEIQGVKKITDMVFFIKKSVIL